MRNKDIVIKDLNPIFDKYKGKMGVSDIKKLILVNGVDAKLENGKWINGEMYVPKNTSPIALASRLGYKDLVIALIAEGADVNSSNGKNRTALTWASFNEYADIVKILIEAGADVNISDEEGYTVLMLSFLAKKSQKSFDIFSMLIEAGADVNAFTKFKETALMFAVEGGYIDIVRMLISANAMINLRNNLKETALDIALKRKHMDIIVMLQNAREIDFTNFGRNYKDKGSVRKMINL